MGAKVPGQQARGGGYIDFKLTRPLRAFRKGLNPPLRAPRWPVAPPPGAGGCLPNRHGVGGFMTKLTVANEGPAFCFLNYTSKGAGFRAGHFQTFALWKRGSCG